MKKLFTFFLFLTLVTACKKNEPTPDVENTVVIEINEPDKKNDDYDYLATTMVANANARVNVQNFGSFDLRPSSPAYWSDADITAAFIVLLQHKYPSPAKGTTYKITFWVYPGIPGTTQQTKTYIYNGSAFVLKV